MTLAHASSLLFAHNGLHFEIQLDPTHPIGESDAANVKDVLVEAALTTIMDCEDSVAAVDAEDKTLVYSNWLGLMKGSLSIEMTKAASSLFALCMTIEATSRLNTLHKTS